MSDEIRKLTLDPMPRQDLPTPPRLPEADTIAALRAEVEQYQKALDRMKAEHKSDLGKAGAKVRAANARADAAFAAGVEAGRKVKPLEWEGEEGGAGYDIVAQPDPYHRYTVRNFGDDRLDVVLNHELGSFWFKARRGEVWPDYASAKAAAQADYEARILSALAAPAKGGA